MKYKTIHNNNSLIPRNRWIDKAFSNHQTNQSTRSRICLLKWCSNDSLDGLVDNRIDGEWRWNPFLVTKIKSQNPSSDPCSKFVERASRIKLQCFLSLVIWVSQGHILGCEVACVSHIARHMTMWIGV